MRLEEFGNADDVLVAKARQRLRLLNEALLAPRIIGPALFAGVDRVAVASGEIVRPVFLDGDELVEPAMLSEIGDAEAAGPENILDHVGVVQDEPNGKRCLAKRPRNSLTLFRQSDLQLARSRRSPVAAGPIRDTEPQLFRLHSLSKHGPFQGPSKHSSTPSTVPEVTGYQFAARASGYAGGCGYHCLQPGALAQCRRTTTLWWTSSAWPVPAWMRGEYSGAAPAVLAANRVAAPTSAAERYSGSEEERMTHGGQILH